VNETRACTRAIYAVTPVFSLSGTRPYTDNCSADFAHGFSSFYLKNSDDKKLRGSRAKGLIRVAPFDVRRDWKSK
jgi:hypothetical protein